MELDLVIILILLVLSGFFSGSESALFSLKWWRIHWLRHRGGRAGKYVAELMDRPRRILITILLGNTLVNVASSSLAEHYLERNFPGQGLLLAISAMTIILLIAGEITPKTLAIQKPERYALWVARPLQLFAILILPLRIILEKITQWTTEFGKKDKKDQSLGKTDFLNLVSESVRAGILTDKERDVVVRILDMEDVMLNQVMVPRTEMVVLPVDISYQEAVAAFLHHDFRRIPLYRGTPDYIVGILYAKDLLAGWVNPSLRKSPKALARTPYFVPNCISLKQLYAELKQKQLHIAIVLDEYGGTAGLITHDDTLSALLLPVAQTGQIPEDQFKALDNNSYKINARISLKRLNLLIPLYLESEDFRTLNGFLLDRFGQVPEPGDILYLENKTGKTCEKWRVQVLTSGKTHIETISLQREPAQEA